MKKPPMIKKVLTRLRQSLHTRQLQQQGFRFARSAPAASEQANEQSITVILNAYKRPGYMAQQVEAIRKQSIPPAQIWVWHNDSESPAPDFSNIADRVLVSNHNWKFFGRFALANLAQTPYVALFDDDILPQPMWFENCLNIIKAGYDGILGGSGILLPASGGYAARPKIGWNGEQLSEVKQVDLVGHAWFARKAHFQYMWREEPYTWENGEDIHLSYTALKHGGIKTYVPPHPSDNTKLWSCDFEFGKIAGGGSAATYKQTDHKPIRSRAVDYYRQNGWQICASES